MQYARSIQDVVFDSVFIRRTARLSPLIQKEKSPFVWNLFLFRGLASCFSRLLFVFYEEESFSAGIGKTSM